MSKVNIDTVELVDMYVNKHLTLRQIAKLVDMSHAGVSKRLKKAGITSKQGEWVKATCSTCSKDIEVTRARFKATDNNYCSSDCYYATRRNPNYVSSRQGLRLARMIVGQYFNLQPEHIVHHIDGNQGNNKIDNLMVFASQSDHMKYHHGREVEILWQYKA